MINQQASPKRAGSTLYVEWVMRLVASAHASPLTAWSTRAPVREADDEEGNACFGIALACILSAPVWAGLALLGYTLLH